MFAYDGLLDLVYGQACLEKLKSVKKHMMLGHEAYTWADIDPDTFRCALEHLMAHKEPYYRMEIVPGEAVNVNVAKYDSFGVPEFDLLDSVDSVLADQGFDIMPRSIEDDYDVLIPWDYMQKT